MDFFYMYLFVAVGIVSIFFILLVDGKHHRKSVEELNKENLKIKKMIKEQESRIYSKHNSVIKANEVEKWQQDTRGSN